MKYHDSDTVQTFVFDDGPGDDFAIEMVEDSIQSSLQIMCGTGEYVDVELDELVEIVEIVARKRGLFAVADLLEEAMERLQDS